MLFRSAVKKVGKAFASLLLVGVSFLAFITSSAIGDKWRGLAEAGGILLIYGIPLLGLWLLLRVYRSRIRERNG